MKPTDEELAAGRQFGESLVRLLLAVDEASAKRRADGQTMNPSQVYGRTEQPKPEPGLAQSRLIVTQREAAKLLSISQRTLWALTAPRGPIPPVRIGRLVRYSIEDIKAAVTTLKSRSR